MYELIQVGPQSYYIESPAKTGIYRRNDTDVYLIDSGNDKEAGKKILKIVSQNSWTVKGIINTHSNADHIGGNNYIQKITGCPEVLYVFLETLICWHQEEMRLLSEPEKRMKPGTMPLIDWGICMQNKDIRS